MDDFMITFFFEQNVSLIILQEILQKDLCRNLTQPFKFKVRNYEKKIVEKPTSS